MQENNKIFDNAMISMGHKVTRSLWPSTYVYILFSILTDNFSNFVFKTVTFEPFLLPTDAHNVKKRRVIKTF